MKSKVTCCLLFKPCCSDLPTFFFLRCSCSLLVLDSFQDQEPLPQLHLLQLSKLFPSHCELHPASHLCQAEEGPKWSSVVSNNDGFCTSKLPGSHCEHCIISAKSWHKHYIKFDRHHHFLLYLTKFAIKNMFVFTFHM